MQIRYYLRYYFPDLTKYKPQDFLNFPRFPKDFPKRKFPYYKKQRISD